MRHVLVFLALAAWIISPTAAIAGTVKMTDWTAPGYLEVNAPLGGGPFKASTVGGPLGNLPAGFLTFCLEFNELFVLGGTYNYVLSDSAILGGVAGGGPGGDEVSDATKWLYYNAITGGYVSLITDIAGVPNLTKSGRYLQEAIWYLEEERSASQIHAHAKALADLAVARTAPLNNAWALLESAGHRVYAMNLTATDGSLKQDQLAYLSVPEPGTLAQLASVVPIALLGYFAVGASRQSRRRRYCH